MTEEPSVLDYVKSKLTFWKNLKASLSVEKRVPLPEETDKIQQSYELNENGNSSKEKRIKYSIPLLTLLALGIALFAQRSLEPGQNRSLIFAACFYFGATVLLVWALRRGELLVSPIPVDESGKDPLTVRTNSLFIGISLALLAFLTFSGNLFTHLNLTLWFFSIFFFLRAFWLGEVDLFSGIQRFRFFLRKTEWNLKFSRWTFLIIVAASLVIFFRAYHLSTIPPEMNSDHAEKLLDVWDVLHGQTHIFFPRNTGREFIQFYLTASIATKGGTGISFISLKIGTLIAALFTLPFIYLLGKELGNREIGFWAALMAGIAYWPNAITRMALRYALYPAFAAPTLYFLVRGLRRSNRNDFILAGLFLGLGLHGYTPFRIMPFIVVGLVLVYFLHSQANGKRKVTILYLVILAVISLVIFMPLLRYALDNPEMFAYRAFTRLSNWERPLPGPAWQIFLQNLGNSLLMFNWNNGNVWAYSIPYRPALGIVSGALLILGTGIVITRYFRQRRWQDLVLLISIPLLMMPSILSLAFPIEVPSMTRGGAAYIPVFLIVGIAMDSISSSLKDRLSPSPWASLSAGFLMIILLGMSIFQNYDLIFHQYYQVYAESAWNSSEMGEVIHDFVNTIGSTESAWVVGYPYWVDTRLVGMTAGYPTKDFGIYQDQIPETENSSNPKLYLFYPEDQETLQELRNLYPNGLLKEYHSKYPNKNFLEYYVFP